MSKASKAAPDSPEENAVEGVVIDTPATTALSIAGGKVGGFTIATMVTSQRYLMKVGSPIIATLTSKFFQGRTKAKRADEPGIDKETMMKAINLVKATMYADSTSPGVNVEIIAPAVLMSELSDKYPKDGYVGKTFLLEVFAIAGVRYKGVNIAELTK